MSRGCELLVREETEWLDVDYLDIFDEEPAATTEVILTRLVSDRDVARDLAARLATDVEPTLHLVSDVDTRLSMAATGYVPGQEFSLADYLDDED